MSIESVLETVLVAVVSGGIGIVASFAASRENLRQSLLHENYEAKLNAYAKLMDAADEAINHPTRETLLNFERARYQAWIFASNETIQISADLYDALMQQRFYEGDYHVSRMANSMKNDLSRFVVPKLIESDKKQARNPLQRVSDSIKRCLKIQ